MENNILLSICIPTYNQPQKVKRLLKSLLPQISPEVEIIVCDDSSNFETENIIKEYLGKTSIKYVLPALAPELSYKNLNIQEGATASNTWNEIVRMKDKAEITRNANNLLTYCQLDTYAMYAIWKRCVSEINK